MLLSSASQLRKSSTPGPRVVIVGSGAVGLYAASELIKRGIDVVVIEAGARHLGNFETSTFELAGRKNDGIRLGRSRSVGGTTNLWGGQLVEFQPVDFAGRDWMPGSKWPVTYDQISPYYPITYENLGIDREKQSDDLVWKSVGASRPNLGPECEPFLTRWLKVPGFARMFSQPIETSERLQLLIEHVAVGFTGTGGRVTGIRVLDKNKNASVIEGDVFILGAGTIENSRLLLHAQSNADWSPPWKGNPLLGAYFQDHLGGKLGFVQPTNTKAFFSTFCTIAKGGHKYQPKVRLLNSVLERERLLNIQGLFAFESSASEHLVYLKQFLKAAIYSRKVSGVGDFVKNAFASARYLVPLMWKYVWDHRVFVPSTSKIALLMQGEHALNAQSCIRIDPNSPDEFGLPKAILDWKLGTPEGKEEIGSIRAFAIRADQALQAGGCGKLIIEPDLLAGNPKFLSTLNDTIHQSGGTIMGQTDRDGVVDPNLRVFGTDNLYIAGSGTFRTVGNANTTFTALAFVTRLVEHIVNLASAPKP